MIKSKAIQTFQIFSLHLPMHPYLRAAKRFPKTQPKPRGSLSPTRVLSTQTPANQINYFQTPSGPLKFLSAGRVQRPPQLVRGSVMLVNIIGFAVNLTA